MSLGALRDPRHRERDGFSALEAAAVAYAHGMGRSSLRRSGTATTRRRQPWPFANYPAALPHVLGVSALGREGASRSSRTATGSTTTWPRRSGRLSTFPVALTAEAKECKEQGYSSCGPDDYRKGDGTSFAAAQVSAAAAVLLALRPTLRPEQVIALLTRTARDVNAASGCRACPLRRDPLQRLGPTRRRGGARRARRRRDPSPRPISSRTTTRARRRRRSGGRSSGSRRRSTSGTTRTTSTRSSSAAANPSTSACVARPARTRT